MLCGGKLQKDGSLKFSSPVLFMSEQVQKEVDGLIAAICAEFKERIANGRSVWDDHFAYHVANMRMVLQVMQLHEKQISEKIEEAKKQTQEEDL